MLKYPKKSHRKVVTLPRHSNLLAEFFGIMMGDGGINNPWQVNITLNSDADAKYVPHVVELCQRLFDVTPAVRKRKTRKAVVVSLTSTSVVDFLVARGLPRGNKLAQGLKIPEWILHNNEYRRHCMRGLMDTDGCLYIHKHKVLGREYKNIGLCFSSSSPPLIADVASLFEDFGIIPHIGGKGRYIALYSEESVATYLKIFGTSNDRIAAVYRTWRGG